MQVKHSSKKFRSRSKKHAQSYSGVTMQWIQARRKARKQQKLSRQINKHIQKGKQ